MRPLPPADVITRCGVDDNGIALFDKDWDHHGGAGFDGGLLFRGGYPVASHGLLSFGHQQGHLFGREHADRLIVMKLDVAHHFLFEETAVVTHYFIVDLDLVIGARIHEDVVAAIVVEVLKLLGFHFGQLHRFGGFKGEINDLAGLDVFEFRTSEGRTLARTDEFMPSHLMRVPVVHDV